MQVSICAKVPPTFNTNTALFEALGTSGHECADVALLITMPTADATRLRDTVQAAGPSGHAEAPPAQRMSQVRATHMGR